MDISWERIQKIECCGHVHVVKTREDQTLDVLLKDGTEVNLRSDNEVMDFIEARRVYIMAELSKTKTIN